MENGVVLGSKTRFGYRTIDGVLTVVPEEAETLRRMFNAYVYENKGSYTIAQELNNDRRFTVTGSRWTVSTVLQMLKCEMYVGDLVQGKRHCSDFLTKTYSKSSEDMIVTIRDHHEAIIDCETWDSAQVSIRERSEVFLDSSCAIEAIIVKRSSPSLSRVSMLSLVKITPTFFAESLRV
jgi:site-specific DNA recombinase